MKLNPADIAEVVTTYSSLISIAISLIGISWGVCSYVINLREKNKIQKREDYFFLINRISRGRDENEIALKHATVLVYVLHLSNFKNFKNATEILMISLFRSWSKEWDAKPDESKQKSKEILEVSIKLFEELDINIPPNWKERLSEAFNSHLARIV